MNNVKITLTALALLLFSLTTLDVHSEEPSKSFLKKGRFGIGANPILGFSNSSGESATNKFSSRTFQIGALPHARFFISNTFGLDVNYGYHFSTRTSENNTSETKTIDKTTIARLGAFRYFEVANIKSSQLFFALGGAITSSSTKSEYTTKNKQTGISAPTGDDESSSLAIQLGIRPEWFVNENLSFHTQVGIVFSILNEDNSGFSEGGINVNIFGTSDLLGASGFTFYF